MQMHQCGAARKLECPHDLERLALFDYLKAGHTVEDFLDDFPSVSRAHAVAVIEAAN